MSIVPQPETDATSSASYWGVIPAPVRYCKALQPAAKLLFTEITALCKREGYCWATNAHFQALYGVKRYTVQRWITALAREGFIRVDLTPGTGIRRIYDLTIPPSQKRDGGVTKKLPPRHKVVPNPPQNSDPEWYIKNKEKKEIESDARGKFIGPGPVAARDLKAEEEKVMASPSTVKSKSGSGTPSASKLRNVERVISLTKDIGGRDNLGRLWDALHTAGNAPIWSEAVDRLKTLPNRSSLPPERLTQTFVSIVALLADMA